MSFYVIRRRSRTFKETHVLVAQEPEPGDRIIGRKDTESAARSWARRAQRSMVLAVGEEIRVHAEKGEYRFSVRNAGDRGFEVFFDPGFVFRGKDEYAFVVDLEPWNKSP